VAARWGSEAPTRLIDLVACTPVLSRSADKRRTLL
jgi:hypothetical protein